MTLPSEPKQVKLSLLENAIDSLNEALANVQRAEADPRQWKFAVLHLVHALELSVKERLHREHRLLLWENVDRPGRTVSLEQALKRLQAVDVTFAEDDAAAIQTAVKWRNSITHYEMDMMLAEVESNFILLFEFLNSFHSTHFGTDLTTQLRDDVTETAVELIARFRNDFIEFRGREMHKSWPEKLLAGQQIKGLTIGGESFLRIPWGSEMYWQEDYMRDLIPLEFCRDCSTPVGELHGPACDKEECPRCRGQFLGCDCDWDPSPLWGLLEYPDLEDEVQG